MRSAADSFSWPRPADGLVSHGEAAYTGRVRKGLCLAAAASLFTMSGPAEIAATPAHPVIRASQAKITLNGYPVWRRPPAFSSPTYAGAIKAFGAPDSCRLGDPAGGIPHQSNFSTVKWQELGVTMVFGSYGSSV